MVSLKSNYIFRYRIYKRKKTKFYVELHRKLKLDNIQINALGKLILQTLLFVDKKIINMKRFSAFPTSLYWHLKETQNHLSFPPDFSVRP